MKSMPGVLALVCCCLVPPSVTSATDGTNFFPVMPWNSPPNDPEVLKKIHDCGFTLAGFVPPSMLDACQRAGLKAIVSDARISGYDWANVEETKARTNAASLV